jgi:formylglycine-generating enzyme required for sulfatase activity
MKARFTPRLAAMAVALLAASVASAQVFNMPSGQTSLQFVTVGDPGNLADTTTGLGAVGYTYSIGKYDVTAAEYVAFLNAVASSDPYGLYTPYMSGSADCNIQRSGLPGGYSYSVDSQWANRPVNYVSYGDAARFCNWLQNGQPTGAEGNGTTELGAYTLNGATTNSALSAITRSANATYFIPSENEWYKAAYYKGGGTNAGYWLYPTQSDTAPIAEAPPGHGEPPGSANYLSVLGSNHLTDVGAYKNSPGPYGTFDQGGELYQWTDTLISTSYSGFAMMDSSWESSSGNQLRSDYTIYPWSPTDQYNFLGFRVAETPEPSTVCLLVTGAGVLLATMRWRNRRHMSR